MTESVQASSSSLGGLAALGMTQEDAVAAHEANEEARGTRNRDRRVCVCGHPMSRHHDTRGQTMCLPPKSSCGCPMALPVVETADVRNFLWQTSGMGTGHALTKGITATVTRGKEWSWIEENLKCFKCSARGVALTACPVTAAWQVARARREKMNALLCQECIDEIGVV